MAATRLDALQFDEKAASHVSHPASAENVTSQSRLGVLRRETSQILSYYESADAGRSEPEYRYPTPEPEAASPQYTTQCRKRHSKRNSNSSSESSRYSESDHSEIASFSDYGPPGVEFGIRADKDEGNGEKNWDDKKDGEDGVGGELSIYTTGSETKVDVCYGAALGSPGEIAVAGVNSTNMDAEMDTDGRDGRDGNRRIKMSGDTDDWPGYGSGIIDPFQSSPRQAQSRPQANIDLSTSPHFSLPPALAGQTQSGLTPLPLVLAAGLPTVDSAASENVYKVELDADVAFGQRRRMLTRGASDKRRVAIVQIDSETEAEREDELTETGRRGQGTLSDGFGRVETTAQVQSSEEQQQHQRHQRQQQQQQGRTREFLVQPLSSPHPIYKATATSALLARRGIVGTFALVAPPDTSPSAYSNLGYFTPPPLSAPPSAHSTPPLLVRHESAESAPSIYPSTSVSSDNSARPQHQRSRSDAVLATVSPNSIERSIPKAGLDASLDGFLSRTDKCRPGHRLRKGSRDIGIVGTASTSISPTSGMTTTDVQLRPDEVKAHTATASDADPAQSAQLSPIFQTPSRSQISLISADGEASESRAQSSTTAFKEPKRRSQQHTSNVNTTNNGHVSETSTTNGMAPRSPRSENTKPAVPGPHSTRAWHTPPLPSSSVYSSYYASNGLVSPAYSYYSMATTATSSSVSSPAPTVLTMPALAPSPYLYYQPGVHATAGPLPSPPRQIIPPKRNSPPPPRPPRLHAPNSGLSSLAKRRSDTSITSKQERASPPSMKPAITSPAMTPSTTSSTLVNSQSDDSVKSKGHAREGAFPLDSPITTDVTRSQLSVKQDQQEQASLKRNNTMDDLVRDVTAAIDEADATARKTNTASPLVESVLTSQKEPVLPEGQEVNKRRSGMDLKREESRSTFRGNEPQSPVSPSSTYSDDDNDKFGDITVTKPLLDPHLPAPQPSPRTELRESASGSKPQKMLDIALKRFSALPRPPSRLSANQSSPRSSTSHERHSQEHSESGHGYSLGHGSSVGHDRQAIVQRAKAIRVAKIRSTCPEAMQIGDVLARRSPLERSLGYARKINELANHDPGLGDWVVITKHNLTVPGKVSKRNSVSPAAPVRSPSEHSFTFHPRQASGGSIGSEMTFPKRVDAYVATDLLSQRSEDETLPRGPPPLPYPTLAQGPPTQQHSTRLGGSNSTRSNASSHGSGKSTGGFFASIGRKASIKRDRPTGPGAPIAQPNKLLSKRQQATLAPAPRPVQITISPSLPGGPRAPPGRIQRAQSVIAPKVPATAESEPETGRRKSTKRSPSVLPSLTRNGSITDVESSADIEAKVNKLADLLPHADKDVLGGYLRRAGGMDMVAIGRYLDDEKNGVLVRD